MSTQNPILEKERVADGAISRYDIVGPGAAAGDVKKAAAASDKMYGVAQHDAVDNARVRVAVMGIAEVKAGGTIADGDLLTSDANGDAVVSAATNRIIGVALSAAVLGDIFPILLSPGLDT